jgi:hypothetical protein
MMFILTGVCFFYKNQSFFYHAKQLPDFISGMFFRSTPLSNKLIAPLFFLWLSFVFNSMQHITWWLKMGEFSQWLKNRLVFFRNELKIGRWFKFWLFGDRAWLKKSVVDS